MSGTAISVRNVSKCYSVFDSEQQRLMHALFPRRRKGRQEIWALKDVSFDVQSGESVAVIGRNGGGKSTLLQILTGTLAATSGEVETRGRVNALLELGSGFNPEYTGRDNVLLNGLLLGLDRAEILRRFDEIVDFAEIGDAIDRPVKTYSSGMAMRLAFAVQVLTDPEILVIDEALSVGDYFFQQKCFRYIRELCEKGVTLLFVSHDMGTVRNLCKRAVYLRQGEMIYAGDSQTATRLYFSESVGADAATSPAGSLSMIPSSGEPLRLPVAPVWKKTEGADAGLLAVEILDRRGLPSMQMRLGETLRMRVYFRAPAERSGHISIVFKNRYDQVVTTLGSFTLGLPPLSSAGSSFGVFQADIDLMLEAGQYSLMVVFARPTASNRGERMDDTGWLGPLRIDWDYERDTAPFLGMFGLPMRGELLGGTTQTQPVEQDGVADQSRGAGK